MFRLPETPELPVFMEFWVDGITTMDRLIRYGKSNQYTYAEQPTAIGQGSQRKINIYCSVSAA